MTRRWFVLVFAAVCMIAVLTSCDAGTSDVEYVSTPEPVLEVVVPTPAPESTPNLDWRIGIITGSPAVNPESYMAARRLQEYHGADRIIITTYPDRAGDIDELPNTISRTIELADTGVDAILFSPAAFGSLEALQAARTQNPDLLIIADGSWTAANEFAEVVDLSLQPDFIGAGRAIIEQAYAQGATTFVHYSFPRHIYLVEMIIHRRDLMAKTAEHLGIEFVDFVGHDPRGDFAPPPPTFITEDVIRKIVTHGVDTAFFHTSCQLQEPLIHAISYHGAIFTQTCCPSPFHWILDAFNINSTDHNGDIISIRNAISNAIRDAGMSGRISNVAMPITTLIIEAGVAHAIAYFEGRTDGRADPTAVRAALDAVAAEYGTTIRQVTAFEDVDGNVIENMFMILVDYYNFGGDAS